MESGLQRPGWYQGQQRSVEIIDGQQRVHTLTLVYAVLQQQLCIVARAAPEPLRQQALDAAGRIQQRFADHGSKSGCLLTSDDMRRLDFEPDDAVLQAKMVSSPDGATAWHVRNLIHTNDWFKCQPELKRTIAAVGPATAKTAAAAAAAAATKWLLGFLRVLDTRVVWTCSLTLNQSLALGTFVGCNLPTNRVELDVADVTRVALASDITGQASCRCCA